MDFDQCICVEITPTMKTHNISITLSICLLVVHLCLHSQPQVTTDLLLLYSSFHFLEFYASAVIQWVLFIWLLWFRMMTLRVICLVWPISPLLVIAVCSITLLVFHVMFIHMLSEDCMDFSLAVNKAAVNILYKCMDIGSYFYQ